LLLDRDHRFREAVGAGKKLAVKLLNPKGANAYVQSLRRGYKPQKAPVTPRAVPASWCWTMRAPPGCSYVGTRIGDYPPLAVVLTAMSALS
jgi:hypothetical protein